MTSGSDLASASTVQEVPQLELRRFNQCASRKPCLFVRQTAGTFFDCFEANIFLEESCSDMSGYVYLLTNSAMPGLAKIGYTDRHPTERAAELSRNTGIPSNFVVDAWWYLEGDQETQEIERRIHQRLQVHRYNKGREFFSLSAIVAQTEIELLLGEWSALKSGAKFSLRDVEQEVQNERRRRAAEERNLEMQRRARVIKTWNSVASMQAMENAKNTSERKISRMKASNYSRIAVFTVMSLGLLTLLLPTAVGNINEQAARLKRQILDDYRIARSLYFKAEGFTAVPPEAVDHSNA